MVGWLLNTLARHTGRRWCYPPFQSRPMTNPAERAFLAAVRNATRDAALAGVSPLHCTMLAGHLLCAVIGETCADERDGVQALDAVARAMSDGFNRGRRVRAATEMEAGHA